MTTKSALVLALSAAFALPACSVDAPERENFDYSFQEEMPDAVGLEFGFTAAPVESELKIRIRDSAHGTDEVDAEVASVPLIIESMMVAREGADGEPRWYKVLDKPTEIDLFELADGDLESVAGGMFPAGEYLGVAIELGLESSVVDTSGSAAPLKLPASVLVIDGAYTLEAGETTGLEISMGALRGLERADDAWESDPNVTFAVIE